MQCTLLRHLKRFNPKSGFSRSDDKRPAGLLLLIDFKIVAQQIIPKMVLAPIEHLSCTTNCECDDYRILEKGGATVTNRVLWTESSNGILVVDDMF